MFKIAVMVITIGIGLWCGWADSYGAFYIAVLVQAVNNLYDSSTFFAGYSRFITVFQMLVFLGALGSFVLAIVHFTDKGNIVEAQGFVIGIVIALSIPIVHFGIEAYNMIREERY